MSSIAISQSLFSQVKDFKISNRLRPTKTVVRHFPVVGREPPPFLVSPPLEPERELQSERELKCDEKDVKRLNTDKVRAHGQLGISDWPKPRMVVESSKDARPGYNTCSAAEFLDEPEVLEKKVEIVADLIRKSSHRVIYSGAGISTASGISDYASKAEGSVSKDLQRKMWLPKRPINPFDAQPTLSHKVLTAMHAEGHLDYWIQQNHDGLPQKAGFPQQAINEIHGAWFDPSNPVVPMNGNLRGDLFSDLLQWEKKVDFCLVLGTSLCGMNSDRIVVAASNAFMRKKGDFAGGAVIVGLQSTKMDHAASVRIFATIDDTMRLLAKKLQVKGILEDTAKNNLQEKNTNIHEDTNNVFSLPYDSRSGKKNVHGQLSKFDFRENAFVKINGGPHDGAAGFVSGLSNDGHFKMTFFLSLNWSAKGKTGALENKLAQKPHPLNCVMGRWWVEAAKSSTIEEMPVTCLDPSFESDAQNIEATKKMMKKLSLAPTYDASWYS